MGSIKSESMRGWYSMFCMRKRRNQRTMCTSSWRSRWSISSRGSIMSRSRSRIRKVKRKEI